MQNITLLVRSDNDEPILLDMKNEVVVFDFNKIEEYSKKIVYMDKRYSICLQDNVPSIINASIFVNGFYVSSSYENGVFQIADNRLFLNLLGFAQLSINIIYDDGKTETLFSDFLNVMVKDPQVIQNIKMMTDYVYKYQDQLLSDDFLKALKTSDLKTNGTKTLESQLQLVGEIILKYKNHYYYFKNNRLFKLIQENKLDNFEKLSYVNQKTIKYIIQNPNELMESLNQTGIKYDDKYYLPQKTLITENKQSVNLYENRIVLSFLFTILTSLSLMQDNIQKKMFIRDRKESNKQGYLYSSHIIYETTEEKLKVFLNKIIAYKNEIFNLFQLYHEIFPIEYVQLMSTPVPTEKFLHIKEYFSIYKSIHEWFTFGLYNFEKETFIVPFLTNCQLYEYYILLKLHNYLESVGFTKTKSERYLYQVRSKNYQNTKYLNSFYFYYKDVELTLFYQPVIYLKPNTKSNNINILRNTKISISNDFEQTGSYYMPDFLIKIKKNDCVNYMVLDAKFSKLQNVKSFYLPTLIYKYIFSLSTTFDNEKILGLCVINGRDELNNVNNISSIYSEYIGENHLPYVDLLTINEFSENSMDNERIHFELLNKLFDKYLNT